VSKTRQGKAMRATAQDPDTAGLMGIDGTRPIATAFVIAGALAGAAGLVQILYNNTTVWNLGFRFGLNAFTSAVLGGIGNLQSGPGHRMGFNNQDHTFGPVTNALVLSVSSPSSSADRPLGQQLADRA
jgi:ribose/xylose/arabinose/galactoside ABC-type transport system permease subunit